MKIAIIGYGVVGKGMEKLLAKRHEVTTFDVGLDRAEVNKNKMAIICVPTPEKEDGSCDFSAVEETISWLETPLILIKSTVPPGTCTYLSNKYGKDVHFSPEYMGESSYYTPFWKYPDPAMAESHTFVIVGGKNASQILDVFMEVMSVDTHYIPATTEEAELTKYMENSFFATKVTFCNEFYDIAKRFGVDYKRLREMWLMDSRINPNHTLVFPEKRGYGGKCFPKDIKGIVRSAQKVGYEPVLLKAVIESNEKTRSGR